VDSIHRNIAEGYCRRSIKEYLQFLNFALGSASESVSGWHALQAAKQISTEQFEIVDGAVYKLENGLIRLVQSLQVKRETNAWSDTLLLRESNAAYEATNAL
jgi:four helix bundle protein